MYIQVIPLGMKLVSLKLRCYTYVQHRRTFWVITFFGNQKCSFWGKNVITQKAAKKLQLPDTSD
jgi:hypothetical protein